MTEQIYALARSDGAVAALAWWQKEAGQLRYGPSGHAIVPAAPAIGRGISDPPSLLAQAGLMVLRHPDEPPPDLSDQAVCWQRDLAWLRLGLSVRLCTEVIAHLSARTIADAPQLFQQLIKGSLADVAIAHLEVHTMLRDSDPHEDAIRGLHEQITDTDRRLLRLLGAYGFTTDGPGIVAHVSELIADAYVSPLIGDTCHDH